MDLFSNNLKRTEILEAKNTLNPSQYKKIKINIHRNHAFEPIESIITPFLAFSNIYGEFYIGAYDDTLSFEGFQKSDLEIIWIDLTRYKNDPIKHIITQINHLKSLTTAPILPIFMDIGSTFSADKLLEVCDSVLLSSFLTLDDLDDVKSSITGTRLSNKACITIAQRLGLRDIPSLLLPALKAIVLDLDNTLYEGILGEDGINHLKLTENHKKLQERILEYKKQGFLLALASKNEEIDAKKLFELRKDFPLKWEDFDTHQVNWNPKANNIQIIAQTFNIGLDSMLFIDDNIAEIESVKFLNIKTILATSPQRVLETLLLFPQMQKKTLTKEDEIRSQDIRANQIRKELENLSQEEYFKNLKIHLSFCLNDESNIQRITELLNKTNQFISNYTRPTLEQVKEWFANPSMVVASISMSDKLSDSGIIAIFVGKNNEGELQIIDLCISCRALGRKLEEIMFFHTFALMKKKLDITSEENAILFQKGERNMPFLELLGKISNQTINPPIVKIPSKNISLEGLEIEEKV